MTVNKKQKHKKDKKSSNTPTRYYDQRLLWLFFLLAGLFLSVRVVVCQHFHVPFLNGIAPDSLEYSEVNKPYKQLVGIITLVVEILNKTHIVRIRRKALAPEVFKYCSLLRSYSHTL